MAKKLREIIVETPQHVDWDKEDHQLQDDDTIRRYARGISTSNIKKLGRHPSGHDIYNHRLPSSQTFMAVHRSGKIHQMVTTNNVQAGNEKHVQVDYLQGHPDSTIKAHDFYHHLVTHHGFTIDSSHTHSTGGRKVWEKMTKMKGLKVTHHNGDGSERQLHKSPHFKDNYINKPDDDEKFSSYFRASKG